MGKNNHDVAHDFYYRGVNRKEWRSYGGCHISYDGTVARSYSTVVAIVIPKKGFTNDTVTTENTESALTLVSRVSMSSTTGRHIRYLASASPFDTVEVPMSIGCRNIYPELLKNNFLASLKSASEELNRSERRRDFVSLVSSLQRIRDEACDEWAEPLKDGEFEKYLSIDVSAEAEKLKAEVRRESAKRAAEVRAILKKYVGERRGADYIEFVHAIFDRCFVGKYKFTDNERSALKRKFIVPGKSYVWVDGDKICTSQGISIPLDEVRVALLAWSHGKDMRMAKIGNYTVVKYEGDEIQIGCHHIPRENMIALYEAVIGRPFAILPKMEAA